MLEVGYIRENRDEIITKMKVRNLDAAIIVDSVIEHDKARRDAQKHFDDTQAEMNSISKSIGQLFKEGKAEEANAMKAKTGELKETLVPLKANMSDAENKLKEALYQLPNVPNPLVPEGKSDQDNEIIAEFAEIPELHAAAVSHWDLAKEYNLIDFELGVKITGAGFPVYRGQGAAFQRALINFFLNQATKAGYEEIIPPLLVNEDSATATGQLPDKEGQMYHATEDDLYLIPTAEVPITNILRNVILKESDFPIKMTGYTPCFRREAGSYGKDVRGLNRLHQFDKVEVVQAAHPDKSYEVLDEMVSYVKSLLTALGLPFRVTRLCGGDLGFTSALTYDLEVYSAAQQKWLEVSSVSNFESFQANRLKLRYKDADGKTQLAHTLNGSALALPRIVAALLENNQTPDGIKVPEVLVPFTGFDMITK
ncbi:MAG: seryl-tRNA synthetase [Parvicellaceae bacterium]|jgi:seryl-tRNA synthetase